MAHTHDVYDTGKCFEINDTSRFIQETSPTKLVLVQGDHKSEVITFKMPRYIDGHDMLTCNKIRVHYINIDTKTNDTSKDIYEVKNLALCEDDENMLTFTWVIEAPATKYAGTLSFLIKFECTEGDDILYQWNTARYVGTNVLVGIDNSEAFIEKYSSVLEQWYNELISGADSINELRDQIISEIENAKKEALNEINNSDVSYYWKTINYSGIDKTFVLDKDFRADDEFTFEFLVANKDLIEIVYIDKEGVEHFPIYIPMGKEYQKVYLLDVTKYVEIRVNSYVNVEHRTRIGTVQDLKDEVSELEENIKENGLPEVSSANEGCILRVVNGAWELVEVANAEDGEY